MSYITHFTTRLKDDDLRALTTGQMYDGLEKQYYLTQRGLAVLEMGYLDIELNICLSDKEGIDLEPAYYICKKCGENYNDWEDVGYADEVLPPEECAPDVDWTVDYKVQLREDMERVLNLYAEKTGLYFDRPNERGGKIE